MSVRGQLLGNVSYKAIVYYWKKRQEEKMRYQINTSAAVDAELQHIFEYLLPVSSVYFRVITQEDIISGSCAKPGWFGYFDADGDLVFWDDDSSFLRCHAVDNDFQIYSVH